MNNLQHYLKNYEFYQHKLKRFLELLFYDWLVFLQEYWWSIGLVSGWFFILTILIKERHIKLVFVLVFVISLIAQPAVFFFLPDISQELWNKYYTLPIKHLYGYVGGLAVSGTGAFFAYRYTSAWFDSKRQVYQEKQATEGC